MKTLTHVFLLLFGVTALAQSNLAIEKKKIEDVFPIESSVDFNKIRSAIQTMVSPRQKGRSWPPQLLETLQNIQQWANASGTSQQKLLAQYYILMYYDSHLENDSIIAISKRLLINEAFMEMPESAHTLIALNSGYRRKGYYQNQLDIFNSLIEQNKKFENIARPTTYAYYNELALVYYNLEQYEFARNNFKQQADIFEKNNDPFRTSTMLNNIGLTYAKQNILDSALQYYNRSLSILENKKIEDDYYSETYIEHFKNVVKSNVVKIDSVGGNFSDALSILENELVSSKKVKELSTTALSYHSIANFYYVNDSIRLARKYIDSTLVFEKKFPNPTNRQRAYWLKAKIALKQNSNATALRYFNLAKDLNDSINREKDYKNYSLATAKYNFLKTGQALAENKKLLQQKERANTIQLVFLCVVVVLGLIIGWMLLKANKSNKLIGRQKEELHKGLKEKETMLDEIHHRIKNNLQVISGILELQRGKIDSEKHIEIYEESQDYLQSISMIHEHLYEQGEVSNLDMQMYLNRLCDLLINSYPDISVKYEASAPTVQLNIKKATPLALLICELITNSLKHAFEKTGKIEINLCKNEDKYELTYRDNGSGFENINNPEYYNTGLNLILMLAEDLDGKVAFFNKDGFACRLTFDL